MREVHHNGEIILFEDDVLPHEIQAALHRIDAQRAAIDRTRQTYDTIQLVKVYLANAEAQAARDAAMLREAYHDAVEGQQRYGEVRREELARAEEEAQRRAAEAAEQERLNSRSWLERRSDTFRERMQPQSEEK